MRCAFLDLDHTIIRAGYRQYLIGKPASLLVEKLGISKDRAVHVLREKVREIMRQKILDGDYLHAFDWDVVLPEALHQLGVEVDRFDALSLLLEAVRSGETSVYPDSIEAVKELRRKYRVCLMTGGLSKYQDAILKELRIENLFDAVLTTDRLGILKVRPEAFVKAMKICDCSSGFHTGDSPSHDITGAKGAGLPAFLMVREWTHLRDVDPVRRVELTLRDGSLINLFKRDILYGFIPPEKMIPDAILILLKEIVPLSRRLLHARSY
ncbi:MAG: HAD family hydrolase [Candidatus Korarchaeota archaeon]|nr:HAD family hydrolase [Candidatus Korarchaeota archaeon]